MLSTGRDSLACQPQYWISGNGTEWTTSEDTSMGLQSLPVNGYCISWDGVTIINSAILAGIMSNCCHRGLHAINSYLPFS